MRVIARLTAAILMATLETVTAASLVACGGGDSTRTGPIDNRLAISYEPRTVAIGGQVTVTRNLDPGEKVTIFLVEEPNIEPGILSDLFQAGRLPVLGTAKADDAGTAEARFVLKAQLTSRNGEDWHVLPMLYAVGVGGTNWVRTSLGLRVTEP
jgi:hypothetical protein